MIVVTKSYALLLLWHIMICLCPFTPFLSSGSESGKGCHSFEGFHEKKNGVPWFWLTVSAILLQVHAVFANISATVSKKTEKSGERQRLSILPVVLDEEVKRETKKR